MQRKPQKILFPTITTTKTRKDKVLSIPKDMHIYYERFVLFHCLIFITIFFQRIKPRITNVSISYYRIEIRGKLLYDKIMAKSFTSLFIQFHLMCLLASRERKMSFDTLLLSPGTMEFFLSFKESLYSRFQEKETIVMEFLSINSPFLNVSLIIDLGGKL